MRSSCDAVKTLRPSANVTRPPDALFDPSRARKPSTTTTSPFFIAVTADAATLEHAWRAGREAPVRHLALIVLHVHVEPDVRVGPLDFGHDAGDLHRLVAVVLCRERVMWATCGAVTRRSAPIEARNRARMMSLQCTRVHLPQYVGSTFRWTRTTESGRPSRDRRPDAGSRARRSVRRRGARRRRQRRWPP